MIVRKMKNKNDVIVKFSVIDSLLAESKGQNIKEYLIEKIKPIAIQRKWDWFFNEIEKEQK